MQARRNLEKKTKATFTLLHPWVFFLAILFGLLSLKIFHVTYAGVRSQIKRSMSRGHEANISRLNRTLISSNNSFDTGVTFPSKMAHSRMKRSALQPESNRPGNRPIPLTSLDDMLLDAEQPVPGDQCLKDSTMFRLEETETKLRASGKALKEHLEYCASTDDCLQLSPYYWKREKGGEPCRKRTHLRCNMTSERCICHDKYDLRWDTEIDQTAYQWNPITKTCYVRGTMPCKLQIPCSPGTRCRSTVSFSYNTPPIQRICECTDIDLNLSGDDSNWWYCKRYWQRSWLSAIDNINKWDYQHHHIYRHFKYKNKPY